MEKQGASSILIGKLSSLSTFQDTCVAVRGESFGRLCCLTYISCFYSHFLWFDDSFQEVNSGVSDSSLNCFSPHNFTGPRCVFPHLISLEPCSPCQLNIKPVNKDKVWTVKWERNVWFLWKVWFLMPKDVLL